MNYDTSHHKCDVSPRQSHPRCKAATVFLWSYYFFVVVQCSGERVTSFIFVLLLWLLPYPFSPFLTLTYKEKWEKEEVIPENVGKGERDEIWIHLKEKYIFTVFITNQDSSVNYKSVLLTWKCYWPIQLLASCVFVYSSPEIKLIPQKTPN